MFIGFLPRLNASPAAKLINFIVTLDSGGIKKELLTYCDTLLLA